jgi:membrane protein implicated in regulation of membrane protease activity
MNMKKLKQAVQWIFAVLFLVLALGTGIHMSSLLFVLAAVLMAPIPALRKKIKLPAAILIIASVVLVLIGAMIAPTAEQDTTKKPSVSQDLEKDEEDKKDETEDKKEDAETMEEVTDKESVGSEQSVIADSSSTPAYAGVAYTVINDKITVISNKYAHIVGNGHLTENKKEVRSNAHTLDWNGNAWFAGDVYVGSTSGANMDEGSKKLLTTDDLDGAVQPMTIEEIDAICTMDDVEALVKAEYLAEATDSEGNILTDNQDNTYVF